MSHSVGKTRRARTEFIFTVLLLILSTKSTNVVCVCYLKVSIFPQKYVGVLDAIVYVTLSRDCNEERCLTLLEKHLATIVTVEFVVVYF